MAYENSGRLFKNDRKTAENHPDYTGDFTDERGKKWRLAAWLKDGKQGKWMSLKVSEERQREPQHDSGGDSRDAPDFDDSIPF